MKKYSFLLAAALLVSCSDDLRESVIVESDSNLVQLGKNFVLTGVSENATRTHWNMEEVDGEKILVNAFLPKYTAASGDLSDIAAPDYNRVGLCWVGQTLGTDVYTNYEFIHNGWLKVDETEADFNCEVLENGVLYSDIAVSGVTVGNEAARVATGAAADDSWSPATASSKTAADIAAINYNSGVYSTKNKAIFGGDYIVYFPYDSSFNEAGTIPAKAQTVFEEQTNFNTVTLADATFRYGKVEGIYGGDKAQSFGLNNLSGIIRVKLVPNSTLSSATADQVILYSEKAEFVKQANLSAQAIMENKKGTDLYATSTGTKTITINATAIWTLNSTVNLYVTALPTTVTDLTVLVGRPDGKWATYEIGSRTIAPGSAEVLEVRMKEEDFKEEKFAVDTKSLCNAIQQAGSEETDIRVIGDIVLDKDFLKAVSNASVYPLAIVNSGIAAITIPGNITLNNDQITVPEDVIMNVAGKVNTAIDVLGVACCDGGTNGGILNITDKDARTAAVWIEASGKRKATAAENGTMNYTALATGGEAFKVEADAFVANLGGNINIDEEVAFYGALTNYGVINVNSPSGTASSALDIKGGVLYNGETGVIEVFSDAGFQMLDASGTSDWDAGQNMENDGKFIHNVTANVAGATQNMKQNGEYRCRIDTQARLNEAYNTFTACSVIEIVDGTSAGDSPANTYKFNAAYANATHVQHNGEYVDIEVNSTSDKTITIDQTTATEENTIMVRNLTVKTGALTVNALKVSGSGTSPKKNSLTVNGDLTIAKEADATALTVTSVCDFLVTGNVVAERKIVFTKSNSLTVNGNVTMTNAELTYGAVNTDTGNENLNVVGNIVLNGTANFNASADDAINITAANLYMNKGSQATFGNRKDGDKTTMAVANEIAVVKGATMTISAKTDPKNIARVTCHKLTEGGTFTGGRKPIIVGSSSN